MNDTTFQALVVREAEGNFIRQVETRTVSDLPAGDVLIRVRYSSLNYKDALSASGNRGVTRRYPHTPGVDAVGEVVESTDPAFNPGDWVITGGFDLGMNTAGGFGQYIRVPAKWLMTLPPGVDPLAMMVMGTAGFTAALSLYKLEHAGLRPDLAQEHKDVLVTGATGGVGSVAVALLSKAGYRVVAATGKMEQAPLLQRLGAADVIHRNTLAEGADKALLKPRWAAVVDTVGGPILAGAIKSTAANGWVTTCGNVASADLAITVYPFILRGVSLLGIDAANCPLDIRRKLLAKLLTSWRIELPDEVVTITDLEGISKELDRTLQGQQVGRVVVDLLAYFTGKHWEPSLMDSAARQATLIYNPVAGFWDWSAVIAKVARFWADEGWTLHIESTRYTGHATELARQAAAANHRIVFAAGGDGTLNEVANGLVGTASALAPMPVGTANSFAKELGLPRPNVLYPDFLLEVSQALARRRVQAMDVGYIEAPAVVQAEKHPSALQPNSEPNGRLNEMPGRYWLLWASTGIDGFIADQIEPRPRWFKYLGPAGYAARALTIFPQFHGLHASITVDDQTLEDDYLLINISNCRMWLGGELRLNQNGVLDDGMFELWLFRGKDWPQLFSYGLEITREEHPKNPDVTVLSCHEVRVTTTPNMAYQLDGEPVADTPFTATMRRGGLLLLAPDSVPAGLFTLPGQPLEVA